MPVAHEVNSAPGLAASVLVSSNSDEVVELDTDGCAGSFFPHPANATTAHIKRCCFILLLPSIL
jgi:hypothetical protein